MSRAPAPIWEFGGGVPNEVFFWLHLGIKLLAKRYLVGPNVSGWFPVKPILKNPTKRTYGPIHLAFSYRSKQDVRRFQLGLSRGDAVATLIQPNLDEKAKEIGRFYVGGRHPFRTTLKPWDAIVRWHLQGNQIIPGFLGW